VSPFGTCSGRRPLAREQLGTKHRLSKDRNEEWCCSKVSPGQHSRTRSCAEV